MSTNVPCMDYQKTNMVPCIEQLDGLHRSRNCRDSMSSDYIAVALGNLCLLYTSDAADE